MRSKKNRGINALKAKYGWICISPWIVGLILFFISPIIQSIIYSFSSVSLGVGGMHIQFVGLKISDIFFWKTLIILIMWHRRL